MRVFSTDIVAFHPDCLSYRPSATLSVAAGIVEATAAIDDLLDAAQRDRDLLPAAQSLDVRFHEFMADEWGMLEQAYAVAGQPLDEPTRAALRAYLDGHGRNRHGRLVYALPDFGYDEADLRARFAPYVDHFGGRPEQVG